MQIGWYLDRIIMKVSKKLGASTGILIWKPLNTMSWRCSLCSQYATEEFRMVKFTFAKNPRTAVSGPDLQKLLNI